MLPESWKFCSAKFAKKKEAIDFQNSTAMVDCLILLANNDKLLARMHEIQMEQLLDLIYLPPGEEYEDTQVRIEVLKNQLVTAD